MKWQRCELTAPLDEVDRVRGLLLTEGIRGWEEQETAGGLRLVFYVGEADDGPEASLLLRILARMPGTRPIVTRVDDEDWAHSWKRFWKPQHIGARFAVVPSWEAFAAEPDDRVITLDPGMAFGSGTHETTQMCMEWVERNLRPGDAVLDLGTGSGILAIAALLLGAAHVLAVDSDPVAVAVARENLSRNRLQGVVRQGIGFDALMPGEGPFDVITANLVAEVIIDLAPRIPEHLAEDGRFIGSGVIREREPDVDEALAAADLAWRRWEHRGEWASVEARR